MTDDPSSAPSKRRHRWLAALGPGLLVAATGVGAGDLATAGFTGSAVGVSILWAVLVGAAVKYVLNEGIARFQLATGETLLEGALRRAGGWARWLFLAYLAVWSFLVGAALLSACGAAAHAILPLTGEATRDKVVYGLLHSVLAFWMVRRGGFRWFERSMAVAIAVMLLTVVGSAVVLVGDWRAVAAGLLLPRLPADPEQVRWTLALLGGVGGTVTLLSYSYWMREEGRRDAAALSLCRVDLAVGYGVTALFGLSMVVLGAGVEVSGRGVGLIVALATSIGEGLGSWQRVLFLAGAWAAIASSALGVWQSAPYLFADAWRSGGDPVGGEAALPGDADPLYRRSLLAIATVPCLGLFVGFARMQKLYAIAGAAFLPLLALALLWLNGRAGWVGEAKNRPATVACLVATLVFFGWMAWRAADL